MVPGRAAALCQPESGSLHPDVGSGCGDGIIETASSEDRRGHSPPTPRGETPQGGKQHTRGNPPANNARGNKGSADPPAGVTLVVAPAKVQEVGAPEEIAPEAAGELGAGTHAPLAASPEFPCGSRLVWAAMPEMQEAVVPATPPRAFLATACPPSSGKRGPSQSCSSASSGSSGGRPSPPVDADGFQLVVDRMGKGRSGAKVPKKARERERDGSL